MKKLLVFIFPFFVLMNVNAQKNYAILRGGVNLANVSVTDNGRIEDASMLTSFQVGIIGNLHAAPFISLQPGVLVTGKGSKTQSGDPSSANYFKATSNPI